MVPRRKHGIRGEEPPEPDRASQWARRPPGFPRPQDRGRGGADVRPIPRLRPRLPPARARDLRVQRARDAPRGADRLRPRGRPAAGVPAARRLGRRCSLRAAAGGPRAVGSFRMELIHTCYRITEVDRSVAFYEALGFEERGRFPIRDEAINVFMGLPGDGDRLELTYNFGVDSYELGTGYGHIAVTVDDLDSTLERLDGEGIEPERPPYSVREGGSRLCFVRDPDGYRIELLDRSGK